MARCLERCAPRQRSFRAEVSSRDGWARSRTPVVLQTGLERDRHSTYLKTSSNLARSVQTVTEIVRMSTDLLKSSHCCARRTRPVSPGHPERVGPQTTRTLVPGPGHRDQVGTARQQALTPSQDRRLHCRAQWRKHRCLSEGS